MNRNDIAELRALALASSDPLAEDGKYQIGMLASDIDPAEWFAGCIALSPEKRDICIVEKQGA